LAVPGNGGTGTLIEPLEQATGWQAWVVQEPIHALGSGPGIGLSVRDTLGHLGDDWALACQDAAYGQGNHPLQAAVGHHIDDRGEKGL